MKLKFVLRAGALTLACGLSNAYATGGGYVGYGLMIADHEPVWEEDNGEWKYDSSTAHQLFGGVTLDDNWAVELGYTPWGLEADYIFDEDDPAEETKEIRSSISIGVRGSYPIINGLKAHVGMGMHRWESEDRFSQIVDEYVDENNHVVRVVESETETEKEDDFYYSVGASSRIVPSLEAGIDYTKYNLGFENIEAWRLTIAWYFNQGNSTNSKIDPSQIYVRGLLNYNKANLDELWIEDFDDDAPSGSAQIEDDTNSMGFSGVVGFTLSETWSLEAGYIDLGESGADAFAVTNSSREKLGGFTREVNGFTYGFVANLDPREQVSSYFRFGMIDWDQTIDGTLYLGDADESRDLDGIGLYAGLGILVPMTPTLSVTAEIDRYTHIPGDNGDDVPSDHTNTFGLGVQYRFGAPSERSGGQGQSSGKGTTACDPKHKDMFWDCE